MTISSNDLLTSESLAIRRAKGIDVPMTIDKFFDLYRKQGISMEVLIYTPEELAMVSEAFDRCGYTTVSGRTWSSLELDELTSERKLKFHNTGRYEYFYSTYAKYNILLVNDLIIPPRESVKLTEQECKVLMALNPNSNFNKISLLMKTRNDGKAFAGIPNSMISMTIRQLLELHEIVG